MKFPRVTYLVGWNNDLNIVVSSCTNLKLDINKRSNNKNKVKCWFGYILNFLFLKNKNSNNLYTKSNKFYIK